MNMTFAQLEQQDFDDAMDSLENLSEQDIQSLKAEIYGWSEQQLEPAVSTLNKYYGTTVPQALLKEVLCEDLSLAFEVYGDSVSDTAPREILMSQILKKLNIPAWPANLDSDEYVESFAAQFKEKGMAAGLKYRPK